MSEIEILWFIFFDTFVANLVFIINSEVAVFAAPILSEITHVKIFLFAFFGVLVANCANYLLGMVFGNIFSSVLKRNDKAQKNSGALKDIFNNFGIYLLLFGFFPVYSKFVTLLTGFCRYKFFTTILCVAVMKTLYYFYYGR